MTHRTVSLRLTRTIDSLRKEFKGYAESFMTIAVRRAHLAPIFMSTFRRWHHETGRSFVAFVHELDPSVPAERDEYVQHRSYQAALYLRRLVDAPDTTPAHRKTVTPFEMLAIVMKSIRPLLPRGREEELFLAVAKASRWRDRDLQRLRKTIADARVIPMPGAPRLLTMRRAAGTHQPAVAADRKSAAVS